MKLSLLVLGVSLSLVSLSGLAQQARADGDPVVVAAPVERVFVPHGFDDNDNVEVVIHGHFRNSCYKAGGSTAKVDHARKLITISPKALFYPRGACAQMLVPYLEAVKVGVLSHGNYTVEIEDTDLAEKLLVVTPRTVETPDDFLYAPVDDIHLTKNPNNGRHEVTLRGMYPLTFVGCAIVTDVKTHRNPSDVVVVQPVMTIFDNDEECRARNWKPRFEIKHKLGEALPEGDTLFHVRVLNGNSLNRLERVE